MIFDKLTAIQILTTELDHRSRAWHDKVKGGEMTKKEANERFTAVEQCLATFKGTAAPHPVALEAVAAELKRWRADLQRAVTYENRAAATAKGGVYQHDFRNFQNRHSMTCIKLESPPVFLPVGFVSKNK